MKREKNVFHLVGVLCLAVALQFFPASTWAETNVFPIVNQQSTYTVTGNIVDGKGEPIIGANVVLKGSAINKKTFQHEDKRMTFTTHSCYKTMSAFHNNSFGNIHVATSESYKKGIVLNKVSYPEI